jgi:hypothetical protein
MRDPAGKTRLGAMAILSAVVLVVLGICILPANCVYAQMLNDWGWTTGLAPMPCAL